jgi:hypothetical protein
LIRLRCVEKAAALYPDARFDYVQLHFAPGRSLEVRVLRPKADAASEFPFNWFDLYLDLYPSEKLGARPHYWKGSPLTKENFIAFAYRLHWALALPANETGV